MTKFDLQKLTEYTNQSLIAELKRVASLLRHGNLTVSAFDRLGKVHSTTLRRRFGDWRKALNAAGLDNRFDGSAKARSREEVLEALRSLAQRFGRNSVTRRELSEHTGISEGPVLRLFGSYRAALEAAGLSQSPGGSRYTDDECIENLVSVWTALGRQPNYGEMKSPPSRIGPKAYISRWGSWRGALKVFVERMNQEESIARSPPNPEAWSMGGETVLENLQTLCSECNLGKGASLDET